MNKLPTLPPTRAAWVMLVSGVIALLVSLWAQIQMWAVEFGMRPVAAGGGEYMVALFFALPLLLLALALLGTSVASRAWSSRCARLALGVALVPTFGWLVLIVKSAF